MNMMLGARNFGIPWYELGRGLTLTGPYLDDRGVPCMDRGPVFPHPRGQPERNE